MHIGNISQNNSRSEHGHNPALRLARMIDKRRRGASLSKIAREFNCSKTTAWNLLRHVPVYAGPQAKRWIPEAMLYLLQRVEAEIVQTPDGRFLRIETRTVGIPTTEKERHQAIARLGRMILAGTIRDPHA